MSGPRPMCPTAYDVASTHERAATDEAAGSHERPATHECPTAYDVASTHERAATDEAAGSHEIAKRPRSAY